jgi:hypothetical protein
MTSGGPNTPLIQAVDKSGFPFQLAVERELKALGRKHSWPLVATEVPVGGTFADIVLQRPGLLGVVECKRVEDEKWHFLVPRGANANMARCRIEWHNPNAAKLPIHATLTIHHHVTKLFCSECKMATGSYESSVCVPPKGKAVNSLEALSGDLLSTAHALGDMFDLKYDDEPTYLIPIVVTNAELMVCEYDVDSLDINLGRLGQVDFKPVNFLRFRKTLVSRASNDYEWDRQMTLGDWTSDRERTVFVVSPKGLDEFLAGFRAFGPAGGGYPAEYELPPEYGSGGGRK